MRRISEKQHITEVYSEGNASILKSKRDALEGHLFPTSVFKILVESNILMVPSCFSKFYSAVAKIFSPGGVIII